ncbi:MAG: [protein-PII] uridylyltransferase [Thermodesulfobacteriota bacterium]
MFHKKFLETLNGPAATSSSLLEGVQAFLNKSEGVLKERHLSLAPGADVCRTYSLVIDDLLRKLFEIKARETGLEAVTALVAVGGYGRSELNVRSDIDCVLLHRGKMTQGLKDFTEGLLYILWDTGLDLGFSVRTVEECASLSKEDLKTLTSLLDARLIVGDKDLYEHLAVSFRKKVLSRRRLSSFIDDKMKESKTRRKKYGGSVYILEPNIKEGEGGLRDFQTAGWILKARYGEASDPVELGLISADEMAALKGSLDFLLWVRNDLHFETLRKTDQLTFDHQERLSAFLGHSTTERGLAVEEFMESYYRNASIIDDYSGLIISRYLHRHRKRNSLWPEKKKRVGGCYYVSMGQLRIDDDKESIDDPLTAIRAFEYAQEHGAGLDQRIKDMILDYVDKFGEGLSASKEAAEAFMRIIRGPEVYRILSMMHKLKFLDKLIPEFGDTRHRVQHDLYHIYTVDAHTLFAIRELERLEDDYKKDLPLLSSIYNDVTDRAVLILAVLFHDIGKPLGKGHSEKGAALIPAIASRLGLGEDTADELALLVKNHLLLADTAQYRDLHDEKLVLDFAKKIEDVDRLNLLYLLTFADVRAVGPDVWSQWKGTLFQELYLKALRHIEKGTFEIEAAGPRVARKMEKVKEILLQEGFSAAGLDEYLKLLTQRYFLSNSAEAIAGHIKILQRFDGTAPYIMKITQDKVRQYTEVIVCTYDVKGLFSMIAGVMAATGMNILGANINTLKNGLALDILQVTAPEGGLVTDDFKLKGVEKALSDVITGGVKVETLAAVRKPSILDRKEKPGITTRVGIDNAVSDSYTVIDILTQNRIGLLYEITSKLSWLGLYIYLAKISTKGDEAADIFYVKDIFGQKIYHREKLDYIQKTLSEALSGSGRGDVEKA